MGLPPSGCHRGNFELILKIFNLEKNFGENAQFFGNILKRYEKMLRNLLKISENFEGYKKFLKNCAGLEKIFS